MQTFFLLLMLQDPPLLALTGLPTIHRRHRIPEPNHDHEHAVLPAFLFSCTMFYQTTYAIPRGPGLQVRDAELGNSHPSMYLPLPHQRMPAQCGEYSRHRMHKLKPGAEQSLNIIAL